MSDTVLYADTREIQIHPHSSFSFLSTWQGVLLLLPEIPGLPPPPNYHGDLRRNGSGEAAAFRTGRAAEAEEEAAPRPRREAGARGVTEKALEVRAQRAARGQGQRGGV